MQGGEDKRLYYRIVEEIGRPRLILIEPAMVPYIFHFSEKTLSHCRVNPRLAVQHPLAEQIFTVLKNRIIPKRKSSRTGRAPTRMKYEQKIKFLMRSLEYKIADIEKRPAQKMIKFNLEEQRAFFQRKDVRQHFQTQVPIIIAEKEKANEIKIRKFEEIIIGVLIEGKKDLEFGKIQLEENIKQCQLPWSIEMLRDIEFFANQAFEHFVIHQRQGRFTDSRSQSVVQAENQAQKGQLDQNENVFNYKQFISDNESDH